MLVNSAFTAAVFRDTFPTPRGAAPQVLHPAVDVERFAPGERAGRAPATRWSVISRLVAGKNLGLAVDAYGGAARAACRRRRFAATRLVIAGGYDARMREGRETYAALPRGRALGLADRSRCVRSPDDAERARAARPRPLRSSTRRRASTSATSPSRRWPPAGR